MSDTELERLYTVLAFDPGGTTGWAVIAVHDGVIGPPPFREWLGAYERNRGGAYQAEGDGADGEEAVAVIEEARLAYKAEVADVKDYKILDNVAFWGAGQYVGDRGRQVDEMVALVEAWPATCPLVVEGFILRQFRMDPVLLEPVRITERFRHAVRDLGPSGAGWRSRPHGRPRDVIQQPPALAKTMVSDDRLRRMPVPFYTGTAGKEHARDAVRHAITFLRREKEARSLGKSLELKPND